jgi:hypothetical protein
MSGSKEKKNLGVENLENRVAPMAVVLVPSEPLPGDDPLGGGGGGGTSTAPAVDQPGNSDNHRAKMYQENKE